MSERDEFQVWLPSSVKGNVNNTPSQYETTLARPLDMPGNWEVALMDVSYPHNWINIDKEFFIGVLLFIPGDDKLEDVNVIVDPKHFPFVEAINSWKGIPHRVLVTPVPPEGEIGPNVMISNREFAPRLEENPMSRGRYFLKQFFSVVPGQYDITSLINYIQEKVRETGLGCERFEVTFNKESERVTFRNFGTRKIILACYNKESILKVLGFEKDSKTSDTLYRDEDMVVDPDLSTPKLNYLHIGSNRRKESKDPPNLKPTKGLFIYSDIIDDVLVGNTQSPLLGYLPVLSKFGEQAYWGFNPAYYIPVKDSNIRNVGIKICNNTGNTLDFKDGEVTCRLHFRRVGMLRGVL